MVSSFDPAAHLHKQGWKGKGTALKQGHATRPLAVVQKKNLGGIGRDRDTAVPFWDQIFAATAASIFFPSPSASGSGTSTPLPSHTAHSTTRSWTTTTFDNPGTNNANLLVVRPKEKGAPSTQARVGKEMARRGLYSRFMRGKTIVIEPEEEEEPVAGPSTLLPIPSSTSDDAQHAATGDEAGDEKGDRKGKRKEREGETKEERKQRRAAKALKKAEKKEKRAKRTPEFGASAIPGSGEGEQEDTTIDKKRKKRKDEPLAVPAVASTASSSSKAGKKEKKRKSDRDEIPDQAETTTTISEADPSSAKPKKEKERRADATVGMKGDASKSEKKRRKEKGSGSA